MTTPILTTGRVARLLGVCARTVAKLLDGEHLHGWRIPGSGHRRVALAEVERFAREQGIELREENQ